VWVPACAGTTGREETRSASQPLASLAIERDSRIKGWQRDWRMNLIEACFLNTLDLYPKLSPLG
jgi:predicted GIY-YIG superfamily endonuclease